MTLEADFAARFPGVTASTFSGNMADLAGYQPTQSESVLGIKGLMTDIGKVMVFQPSVQLNPYSKYIKSPLTRGDAAMAVGFKDIKGYQYDALADDSVLFNAPKGEVVTNVAKINMDRQYSVEINRRMLARFQQMPGMEGDIAAGLVSTINQAYMQDMYIACREYYSNLRNAKTDQCIVLTEDPATKAGAEELNEAIWQTTQNKASFLDTRYNQSGIPTKSDSMDVIMKKTLNYPLMKKLLSETFHPDMVKIQNSMAFVPEFGSVIAGAPADAGEMIAVAVDPARYAIHPAPNSVVTSSFWNPARLSETMFQSVSYCMQDIPFKNAFYFFAPKKA